jgi:transglutaminase-like putative cysteine protease
MGVADFSNRQGNSGARSSGGLEEARMMLRMVKSFFSADALGLIMVVLALFTLTYGLSASVPGTNPSYLFLICLLAALIAFGLNRRQFSGGEAAAVMGAVGVIGIWILGARLTPPLINLFRSLFVLIPQIVPAWRDEIPIDTSHVMEAWLVILQASFALATRWQNWLTGIQNNSSVNDVLIRNMVWILILWLVAAWTGWFASQRKAVLALLPQILLLAAVISYSEYKVVSMWLMILIQLLLLGIWNYKNHTTHWEHHKIDYSESIRYDNAQAVFLLAAFIGVLAFIAPSFSWNQVRDYFQRKNENQAAKILGILEQKVVPKTSVFPQPALPREHLLTQGFEQSQQIVMTVRTGEFPSMPTSGTEIDAPQHYWRSTVYDRYVGAGWVTSGWLSQNYKANTPLIQGLLDGYRPLHLGVDVREPQGRLFWSGLLYSANVPLRVGWRVKPQSNLFADQTALLQADVFDVLTNATSYEVDAYLPTATIENLRNASTEYPDEIRELYLQLPEILPERVHELAKQITDGIDNPYDKAKAIESYLRTYPYDLKVPTPPANQDVADYFLFDLKKGYCDYYATAMVVLTRSSGIPARFVSGFSSGSYDPLRAEYVVRGSNAHSWAEVYFPQIGWIEFEPTAAQPEIKRLEKENAAQPANKPVTSAHRFLFQLTHTQLIYWLSPFGLAIAFVILYYAFFERMLFTKLAPSKTIPILYRRYYRLGRPLAGPRDGAETAHEFNNKVFHNILDNDPDSKLQNVHRAKQLQQDMNQFTDHYSSILFSNHEVDENESKAAYEIWRRLRFFLMIERMKSSLFKRNKATHASYTSI